jgi:hypothetical protein
LFRQGKAWLEAGDPARAIPPLERAHTLEPDVKIIGLNLARARRESGQASENVERSETRPSK